MLWCGWRRSGAAAVARTAVEFRTVQGVLRSALWVTKRLWKKGKYVNMYVEGEVETLETEQLGEWILCDLLVRVFSDYQVWDSVSNWVIVTRRQCPKLGHLHLKTVPQQSGAQSLRNMPQIVSQLLGDSASNCGEFTWRRWLKPGHVHLDNDWNWVNIWVQ
jgi:hypothetical protein